MNPKLKAIFLMDEEVLPQVYGLEEFTELAGLTEFTASPLNARTVHSADIDLSQVEVVFSGWGMPSFDEALLARLPACRVVFHAAGTVRSFATPAMWHREVRVTTAAEANAVPVAEYTLATIILSLKHAWPRLLELRERGEYRRTDPTMPGAYGSTVGLLGLSRIGRMVAERLKTFDVRVIACDPVIDPAVAAALGVELCPLAKIFSSADVVSCHLPLLPQTTRLLRAEHFAAMKAGATFINTARGAVADESELLAVMRARPELFAVLDVMCEEPVTPNSTALALPNVVVTPHIAGSLGPECRRLGRFMVDEARRYVTGEPLRGEIRATDLARMA